MTTTKNILATLATSVTAGAMCGLIFFSAQPASQRRLRSVLKDNLLKAIGLYQTQSRSIITDHGINELILILYKFSLTSAKYRMAIGGTIGGALGTAWLLLNYLNTSENRDLKKEIERLEKKVENLEKEISTLRRPLNSLGKLNPESQSPFAEDNLSDDCPSLSSPYPPTPR